MAIRVRRGNEANFDKDKLLPGESATVLDKGQLYHAIAPGNVKRIVTEEEIADLKQEVEEVVNRGNEVVEAADDIMARADYAVEQVENIIAEKVGINDVNPTNTQAYSGVKVEERLSTKAQYIDLDSQTGTFIHTEKSEDSVAEIVKVEGKTVVTPANPDEDISPDNVAEIKSAGPCDVVSCNKNLFDKSISAKGWYGSDGEFRSSSVWYIREIPVKPNTDITFSGIAYNADPHICGRKSDGAIIPIAPVDNRTINTSDYVSIIYSIHQNYLDSAQVEIGSTPTDYTPHQSDKITLDMPLRDLPDGVKDELIYLGGGKAKYIQRIDKAILTDDDANLRIRTDLELTNTVYFEGGSLNRLVDNITKADLICDKFKSQKILDNDIEGIVGHNTKACFRILKSRLTTLDVAGFRQWLSENPVTIYYELAEPIETIIDLPTLKSYAGVTNIYTTSEVQPAMTVNFKSRLWNDMRNKADLIDGKIPENQLPDTLTEGIEDINRTIESKLDKAAVGVEVASLGEDGKVPNEQLPEIASSADKINYDNTYSGISATNVQDAIDEISLQLANKADQSEIERLEARIDNAGGGGVPPSNVINPSIIVGNSQLTIKWDDPEDTVVDGQLISTWAGTKLVRKAGSYPTNEKDGVVLVDNKVRGAYASSGYVDSGLTNGTTYYYQLFPYNDQGAVNRNEANRLSGTPQPFKIFGVRIDLTNSNPETSVTYTDDAVGMTGGAAAWDSMDIFKDIKPCVLKNGVVQYYLDPNDFTKRVDGSAADITSGNDGDVMIEIPKTGFLISTVGNILTVKVTDDPNNPNFKYYAHSRATEGDRSKLYIGAYLGWKDGSNKLRSLSGKTPIVSQTIGTFRTQAKANGSGYDLVSFYPLTLLQCLYLIRYKNLDSQTALGRGYVDGSAATNTGRTNAKGMFFGETTGKHQMKFLGIEDFWGNLRWWIDGLYSDKNYHILTAFKDFNDTGEGYVDNGQGATANISGYMSKPQGSNEAGFVLKEANGSETTYFCDSVILAASRLPIFGGSWAVASAAGAFGLSMDYTDSSSISFLGGRLMYL